MMSIGSNNDQHGSRQTAKITAERCLELARLTSLDMDDFIELTRVGGGSHGSYFVNEDSVTFKKWETDYIDQAPIDWQVEMRRDNRTAPQLTFPCSPADLIQFIDKAIGIHCFGLPEAFRRAVAHSDGCQVAHTETPQQGTPIGAGAPTAIHYGPKRDAEISARINHLRASGVKAFLVQVASEYGVHQSAIKQAVKRHASKSSSKRSSGAQTFFAAQLTAANKSRKTR